jgi:hypothetical protein
MKIVLCMPGNTFSREVVLDLLAFLNHSQKLGWDVTLKTKYTANVYKVRDDILEGNPVLGEEQKPFNGKIEYDYVLWIDSDIRFNIEMIKTLISHKKDVITGLYRMRNGKYSAMINNEDFISYEDLQKRRDENDMEIFTVNSCGLGICLMSRKALETIKYPWFRPIYNEHNGNFLGEDTAICVQLRRFGFDIYCDPNVIAGHMKMFMI